MYRYYDEVITHKQEKMCQRILQIEKEGEVRRKWEGSRPSRSLLFHTDGGMEREGYGRRGGGQELQMKRYPRDGEM